MSTDRREICFHLSGRRKKSRCFIFLPHYWWSDSEWEETKWNLNDSCWRLNHPSQTHVISALQMWRSNEWNPIIIPLVAYLFVVQSPIRFIAHSVFSIRMKMVFSSLCAWCERIIKWNIWLRFDCQRVRVLYRFRLLLYTHFAVISLSELSA